MIFSPSTNSTLWDVWLYHEDDVHYLFYLANSRPDRPWDGIGLATSQDGVHYDDHGLIVKKADDAEYLGAGHTWWTGDRYVLNFSECRSGTLEIFFAESDDLRSWRKIPAEESTSRLDPRWYAEGTEISDQRWDNIWAIPDASGDGFFGYVTAVAQEGPVGLRGTCASVTSTDGRTFVTGPPVIEPGVWPDRLEIGGAERIGDDYYMFAALAEIPLGLEWARHHAQGVGGVYVLRSSHQEGPFELDPRQAPVLVSAPDHHTYFARFYRYGNEMLAAHHSLDSSRFIATVQPKMGTYFAPLKKVQVDDGILSLRWWHGNDALKGSELPTALDLVEGRCLEGEAKPGGGLLVLDAPLAGQAALPVKYDLDSGVVVEAHLTTRQRDARPASVGLLIEGDSPWNGTLLVSDTQGRFSVGTTNGYTFKDEDGKDVPPLTEAGQNWRVLIRGTFVEVYIDEALVQCFSLPEPPRGRIAFVSGAGVATVSDIKVWQMNL